MPKVSGYVRFKTGWSEVGFTDHWGVPYTNIVYLEMGPDDNPGVYIRTIVNSQPYDPPKVVRGLERDKVYPFTLEYSIGGQAHGVIAGQDLGTSPAPAVDLPFSFSNSDYYAEGPNYRNMLIGGSLVGVVGGVVGYAIKPKKPLIPILVGVGLGVAVGCGIVYITAK